MHNDERKRLLSRAYELEPGEVVCESTIVAGDRRWKRIVLKTHVIQPGEDIVDVAALYAGPQVRRGDVVFIGQKATSIAQGRLLAEAEIRPRPFAVFLSRFVRPSPYGMGLRRPTTMEMALRVAGLPRILVAAAAALVGRAMGRRGVFFRVAGRAVTAIDGATDWALPPFNRCVVLAPLDPNGLARRVADRLDRGIGAAIVDLNDVGSVVLGASPRVDRRLLAQILRDNPLGQDDFQTPLGIVRPLWGPAAKKP